MSTLIVPTKARKKAERILGWAKLRAEWSEAPSAEAVMARDEERMLADPAWDEEISESVLGTVETLVDRYSVRQIAAAYLRLYHERHSVPEELSGIDAPAKPRAAFGPSVWFSISTGRNQNAEPRRLLPMLCKAGGLTKDDIGAIRVQPDESFVEIREASVPAFLDAVGPDMTVEPGAVLTRLDSAPAAARSPRPAPKPRAQAPVVVEQADTAPGTTTPVDWNDDPAPRVRKPKAPKSPGMPKARHKPEHRASHTDAGPAVTEGKPRAGGSERKDLAEGKRKGPPPPTGKPSSKKNKARARFDAKGSGKTGPGGPTSPKRKKK